MGDTPPCEQSLSAFYLPLKNDVKHFSSIIGILDKLELDKNLELLGISFTRILESELNYAIVGGLIRTAEASGVNPNPRHPGTTGHQHPHFQGQSESDFFESQ